MLFCGTRHRQGSYSVEIRGARDESNLADQTVHRVLKYRPHRTEVETVRRVTDELVEASLVVPSCDAFLQSAALRAPVGQCGDGGVDSAHPFKALVNPLEPKWL